jgi:hydrogenase maturation protease
VRESPQGQILAACIGNVFLGDDGFGCAVARELATLNLGPEIRVIDYGIRGLDLAYALLEPYKAVIFVDAIQRGGQPGTVYVLQCENSDAGESVAASLDPHSMDPAHLLAMARLFGVVTSEIYVVGCEPNDFGDELTGRMGLSPAVAAAVPEAARAALDLAARVGSAALHATQAASASN